MADAEDLKSSGDFSSWGFDSPPGHHSDQVQEKRRFRAGLTFPLLQLDPTFYVFQFDRRRLRRVGAAIHLRVQLGRKSFQLNRIHGVKYAHNNRMLTAPKSLVLFEGADWPALANSFLQ